MSTAVIYDVTCGIAVQPVSRGVLAALSNPEAKFHYILPDISLNVDSKGF
jgi:hypothetical protein